MRLVNFHLVADGPAFGFKVAQNQGLAQICANCAKSVGFATITDLHRRAREAVHDNASDDLVLVRNLRELGFPVRISVSMRKTRARVLILLRKIEKWFGNDCWIQC